MPLADPVAESHRLVDIATARGLMVRILGGAAVVLKSPDAKPLMSRPIGDIDVAVRRGSRGAVAQLLADASYVPDGMFNALNGARRLLFYDEVNERKLDVFVGEFSMCHAIPITDRLERDPLTLPLAELLLTKLQIVELTERDQKDIYNLSYHHPVTDGMGTGIEGDFIADICGRDWGLWRTATANIARSRANLSAYELSPEVATLIGERLDALGSIIEKAPKSTRWRLRSRVGDRVRWYDEPEENVSTD